MTLSLITSRAKIFLNFFFAVTCGWRNHASDPSLKAFSNRYSPHAMADPGPILVKSAPEESENFQGVRVEILSPSPQRTLAVPISDEILGKISENTNELQEKLNKFVNGLNSKIQSVNQKRICWLMKLTSRTNTIVQAHQTQSLRTVAEAQHCNESLKQLIEEYEELEAGFEEVRKTREIVYIFLSFCSYH